MESRRKWRTEYTKLLDRERHLAVARAAAVGRQRGERERVVAGRQSVPVGVASGDPERAAPGPKVAPPDEQAEGAAERIRHHHVDPSDPLYLGSPRPSL